LIGTGTETAHLRAWPIGTVNDHFTLIDSERRNRQVVGTTGLENNFYLGVRTPPIVTASKLHPVNAAPCPEREYGVFDRTERCKTDGAILGRDNAKHSTSGLRDIRNA
jgi:hypothetical protein